MAIIILAAGNSRRLGSIKQLLPFNGKTLLQHVVDEAEETGPASIVVVTGANANEVSTSISSEKIQVIFNEEWERGMASGIVAGIQKAIALNDKLAGIIIAVCDQPFVSAALFQELYTTQAETAKHIVACAYADTIGTPVLFTQKYFDALMGLRGDEGAKKLVKSHQEDVATVSFPKGYIDIDTQKDYEDLIKPKKYHKEII